MTFAQDGPGYFLDEYTKQEIARDVGSCELGVAYVRDEKTGKWRKVTAKDYEAFT